MKIENFKKKLKKKLQHRNRKIKFIYLILLKFVKIICNIREFIQIKRENLWIFIRIYESLKFSYEIFSLKKIIAQQ